MYRRGEGVPENYAEAAEWFREAAEQGFAAAQSYLGFMYDKGWGVPENDIEAAKWFRKAAEQGYVMAQFTLGHMYVSGRIVSRNYVRAYMWGSLAKTLGNTPFSRLAAEVLDLAATQMNTAQIAKAQELAAEWWEKHNN